MRVRLEKDGATVLLAEAPLKRAGEGAIYLIPERPVLVAKLYHQPTPERADKLAAMIAHPPDDPTARQGHASIAWPTDRVLDADGGCVGFAMPYVEKAHSLFEIYNPRSRQRTWPLFHYGYLLRTASNLAVAVQALHRRDYVLGDLNESNVLVNSQTMITVIDTDSFQVQAGDRLFRCLVGKPDYTAPEIQNADFSRIDRKPEQDDFALAVLIFQLLMQGTHPFDGRFTGTGEPPARARRITDGYWPYALSPRGPFAPSRTAPPFAMLAPQVQALMRRCFDDGHDRPSARPAAADWMKALKEADAELKECPANSQHRFHKSQEGCPWCELELKQGRVIPPPPEKAPVQANGSGVPTPPLAAVAVPQVKPTPVPQSKPSMPPTPGRAGVWKRAIALLPPALWTPWPWAVGGGASALLLLVAWIAPNALLFTGLPLLVGFVGLLLATLRVHRYAAAGWKRVATIMPPYLRTPWPWAAGAAVLALLVVGGLLGANALWPRCYPIAEYPASAPILGLALSSNGEQVLCAEGDGTLRLWDVHTGKELHRIDAKLDGRHKRMCVALSPDGQYALCPSENSQDVVLWDLVSGKFKADLLFHAARGRAGSYMQSEVTSIAISADGHNALVGDGIGRLFLWNVGTGKAIDEFQYLPYDTNSVPRKDGPVNCADFYPAGARAVTTNGFVVHLWDAQTGNELHKFNATGESLGCAALGGNGYRLLTGGSDGTLYLWDTATGKEIRRFVGHKGAVQSVALSQDGKRAVSAGADQMVRVWDLSK